MPPVIVEPKLIIRDSFRIVLQGQELLTSNMMVRCAKFAKLLNDTHVLRRQDFSHGCCHSLNPVVESASELVNRSDVRATRFILGQLTFELAVFFGNLTGSLFFAAILTHCTRPLQIYRVLRPISSSRLGNRLYGSLRHVYPDLCYVRVDIPSLRGVGS